MSSSFSILELIEIKRDSKSIPSHLNSVVLNLAGSGFISINENLLLKAVSNASTLLSAVFIVPIIYKFGGTPKSSFE